MDLDRSARVWGAIKATAHRDGMSPTLLHAVRACTTAMSAIGAGFSVTLEDGTWEPLLASGTEAGELDELQFTLGEGPGADAVRRGTPVLELEVAGLRGAQRWPAFAAAAAARGVGAAFAFPVGLGAARLGVLTVYRAEAGPVRPSLLADALVYADALLVLTLDDRNGVGTGADEVVTTAFSARRAEVHQATGVVAAQLGVSITDALARLRAYAYSSGLSLQVVATEIMAGRLHLETDTKETGSQHAELEQEEDS